MENLAFYDGSKWYTPIGCLLPGTMRQNLIDKGKLNLIDIAKSDLKSFKSVCLFNALIPFGQQIIQMNTVFS